MSTTGIETPHPDWSEMAKRWSLTEALRGGTDVMQSRGAEFLPPRSKETTVDYDARVAGSVLFQSYDKAVTRVVSKPFQRAVAISDGALPGPLAELETNTDNAGRPMSEWLKDAFEIGVDYGMVHVLIDAPSVPDIGRRPTRLDEARMRLRPWWVLIPPRRLFWWDSVEEEGGDVLSEIRLQSWSWRQSVKNPRELERVHRIKSMFFGGEFEVHEKGTSDDDYALIDAGRSTFPSPEIPLVTIYFKRTGFMTATSTMMPLAFLNRRHWVSSSHQTDIVDVARIPILFAKGMGDSAPIPGDEGPENAGALQYGPRQAVMSNDPEADMKWVEHEGHSIAAGERDLDRLESQMEAVGMLPLIRTSGQETATAKNIDEGNNLADAQRWVRNLELGAERCVDLSGEWFRQMIPEDRAIDVFNDFALSARTVADLDTIMKMRGMNDLSRETVIEEVRRRGIIDESIVVDEEIERIEAERDDESDRTEKSALALAAAEADAARDPQAGKGEAVAPGAAVA